MNHKFIDTQKLAEEIKLIHDEREYLKKKQASLRVKESRYRKLLKEAGIEQYGKTRIL